LKLLHFFHFVAGNEPTTVEHEFTHIKGMPIQPVGAEDVEGHIEVLPSSVQV
jgi:hypothetical protein